jgi:hypothetical protein
MLILIKGITYQIGSIKDLKKFITNYETIFPKRKAGPIRDIDLNFH